MTIKTNLKTILLNAILFMAITTVGVSCDMGSKGEDTKDVAEEHNDAKFNSTNKEEDAKFLVSAAEINLEEIQLGILAQQKSKLKSVTDLGKMMEEGHNKLMTELTDLAAMKVISIPSTYTEKAMESMKKLSTMTGKDFDKLYSKMTVDNHTNAVSIYEKASTNAADSEIMEWALKSLPILRTHLDHAITCQKECEQSN